MKAKDILEQCKNEVAKKYGYRGWKRMSAIVDRQLPNRLEQASLLAMEKIAELSWDKALDELIKGMKDQPLVNKSTYMNNLFPKIC